MKVLHNDPPRQRLEGVQGVPSSLTQLIAESDILTLHVPLTSDGEDRTRYLINSDNLARDEKNAMLINTSRGEVVDNCCPQGSSLNRDPVMVPCLMYGRVSRKQTGTGGH